jgi:hypothetical protein
MVDDGIGVVSGKVSAIDRASCGVGMSSARAAGAAGAGPPDTRRRDRVEVVELPSGVGFITSAMSRRSAAGLVSFRMGSSYGRLQVSKVLLRVRE